MWAWRGCLLLATRATLAWTGGLAPYLGLGFVAADRHRVGGLHRDDGTLCLDLCLYFVFCRVLRLEI